MAGLATKLALRSDAMSSTKSGGTLRSLSQAKYHNWVDQSHRLDPWKFTSNVQTAAELRVFDYCLDIVATL